MHSIQALVKRIVKRTPDIEDYRTIEVDGELINTYMKVWEVFYHDLSDEFVAHYLWESDVVTNENGSILHVSSDPTYGQIEIVYYQKLNV